MRLQAREIATEALVQPDHVLARGEILDRVVAKAPAAEIERFRAGLSRQDQISVWYRDTGETRLSRKSRARRSGCRGGALGDGHLGAVHLPDVAGAAVVEPEQVGRVVAGQIGDAIEAPFGALMARRRDDLADAAAGHVPDLHVVVAVDPYDVGGAVAIEIADPRHVPLGSHRADIVEAGHVRPVHRPDRYLTRGGNPQRIGPAVATEVADRGDIPLAAHLAAGDTE